MIYITEEAFPSGKASSVIIDARNDYFMFFTIS